MVQEMELESRRLHSKNEVDVGVCCDEYELLSGFPQVTESSVNAWGIRLWLFSHWSLTLISSSVTVKTSSTRSLIIGQVLKPMLDLTPSAMVSGGWRLGVSSPFSLDW